MTKGKYSNSRKHLEKADNIKYAKGLSHSEENKLTMNKSIISF